jgi:uncharacterized protein (TIGR03437 family)
MRLVLFLISIVATAGEFTTSLGDTYPYNISSIATDAAGNTYVVGVRVGQSGTLTGDGVTILVYQAADVFISKLDPTGKLLFTNTYAGNGVDIGSAIALDPSGNIYIAGTTTSNNFPLSHALQTQANTAGTGFIMKLSKDGTTILYSTYFGGTLGKSAITALATDSKGNLYLTGYTESSDFPHTAGMPFGNITRTPISPSTGVILASISAAGDKILYSGAIVGGTTPCTLPNITCSSSAPISEGVGIGVDGAGNAYVTGNYLSFDLPSTAGVLSPKGIGAFVAKVNAGGAGIGYLTYIGSGLAGNLQVPATALNTVTAVAVDAAGNAYLAGNTLDPNFPSTAGSYQSAGQGGFVAKVKPDGSAMTWATYLNGTSPQSIGLDATGNVWVTGTAGLALPNANGWTTGPEFLASLDSTGSKLTYSALYPSGTVAQSVAVDQSGYAHVAGLAGFTSAVRPGGAASPRIFGFGNGAGGTLTARVPPAEVIAIYGPSIGPATAATAAPANGLYPTTLSGVQVTINGVNAPLLYVSANQINAVIPLGLTPNSAATVRVTNGTTAIPDFPLRIIFSSPLAFAPVLNSDGTINSQSNPAAAGSFVTYYGTGWQPSFAPLTDGQVATTAQDTCLGNCRALAVTNAPPPAARYTLTATALYAGFAPGIIAGVTQFNVQLGTANAPPGAYAFILNVSLPGMNAMNETVWVKAP